MTFARNAASVEMLNLMGGQWEGREFLRQVRDDKMFEAARC